MSDTTIATSKREFYAPVKHKARVRVGNDARDVRFWFWKKVFQETRRTSRINRARSKRGGFRVK